MWGVIRLSVAAWFVCTLICVSGPASCRTSGQSESLCGPKCLLVACQRWGIATSLEELTVLCGFDKENGTTVLGLANAARAKGLEAVGMKIGLDELTSFKGLTIAHLWGNHFVVIESGGSGFVSVTDPPQEPRVMKTEDLSKRYSGFALLVAKDVSLFPEPRPNGPDLRFDGYSWDFGSVNQGDSAEHVFKCRNVGNADLVISKVETSCGDCVVPIGGPQTIAPGGDGEVKALVVTANQRRGVAKELYIHSNDSISPVVHLAVTGYVRPAQLVFSPRTINLGSPRRTETVSAEVYVPSSEEDKIEVTSVSSDSPYLIAELSPSEHKDRPGYIVKATLKPGAPLGEFKGSITIISNHWKQPKVEIPVTATIRGNIDLDRDSFFFGMLKKGDEKKCAMTISTVADKPLTIDKIDNSLPYLSIDVSPKVEGKEYTLTATLKPDAPVGNIKDEVTLHTNDSDQVEIRVPVYAYVEDLATRWDVVK